MARRTAVPGSESSELVGATQEAYARKNALVAATANSTPPSLDDEEWDLELLLDRLEEGPVWL